MSPSGLTGEFEATSRESRLVKMVLEPPSIPEFDVSAQRDRSDHVVFVLIACRRGARRNPVPGGCSKQL